MLDGLIQLVQSLQGNPLSLPVFFLLYAAACFVAPIGVFPVIGGVLFGFGWGMVVNLAAVLTGASGAFWVARALARERASRILRRWGHRGVAGVVRNPGPGVFIVLRLLGFPPFVIANYMAGVSHMRWRRLLWTSLIGLLPWTFLMTFFAGTFWEVLQQAGIEGFRRAFLSHAWPLLMGAILMASLLAGGMLVKKWMDRRVKFSIAD